MAINLDLVGRKLRAYREQLEESVADVAVASGIPLTRVADMEAGKAEPTGDEILILADHFHCDFRYFIANEQVAPFEQTGVLYRMHGNDFSKEDRRSIQEFLYLCETEAMLMEALDRSRIDFKVKTRGSYFKKHAEPAAEALRGELGYKPNELPRNVFAEFRRINVHVFRRRLVNSSISGVFIRHPIAGNCALVNYDEDVYRQRFSAAHEVAHAIFDHDQEARISQRGDFDLRELRADTFASFFLMPRAFLKAIPVKAGWSDDEAKYWANEMCVSCSAFGIALLDAGLVDKDKSERIRKLRVSHAAKVDPELSSLSVGERQRKTHFLELGLSDFYVELCFEAFQRGVISRGRLAEALLVTSSELPDLAKLYGRSIHGH